MKEEPSVVVNMKRQRRDVVRGIAQGGDGPLHWKLVRTNAADAEVES